MLSFAFILIAFLSSYPAVDAGVKIVPRLCSIRSCFCKSSFHPSWDIVNCTLSPEQNLYIRKGDLPERTTAVIIVGGNVVTFDEHSLSDLRDTRQIYISKTKTVIVGTDAGVQIRTLNFYLYVEHCNVLRFEKNAFRRLRGPLSVKVFTCGLVTTEGETFSWLQQFNVTNITKLQIAPETFTLEPDAGNIDEHGPGMKISMKNVVLQDLPFHAFGSSAAEIIMQDILINDIQSGAFSANTYNIVMAINCSVQHIQEEAFAQRSLIHSLSFINSTIHNFNPRALLSAIGQLSLTRTLFVSVYSGAINITVASVTIQYSTFIDIKDRAIELSSWTSLEMTENTFDVLPSNAFIVFDTTAHEESGNIITLVKNEFANVNPGSLKFIGQADAHPAYHTYYRQNYYGQECNCNISQWLSTVLGTEIKGSYLNESYCTIDAFLTKCFNLSEPNILLSKFEESLCGNKIHINCASYIDESNGSTTEILNPRFRNKNKNEGGISDRNIKVIGIITVTCVGCFLIVMFISFIRRMRRRGYCDNLKNILISSKCGSLIKRLCFCSTSNGLDSPRSISRLSLHEYSERYQLNEPRRTQELVQETIMIDENIPVIRINKTTQTLPAELTQEILDSLRQKLDIPEKFLEAHETIEHLYDLIKLYSDDTVSIDENIYELPYQNTMPHMGWNRKQMISIGTRTPSLDKLQCLPYKGQPTLVHEYFEPTDLAIHVYAEIFNDTKLKTLIADIPDVVMQQVMPRGPYLQAVSEKKESVSTANTSSLNSNNNSTGHPKQTSTIKSTSSNSSGKMVNRPLPETPTALDPGEGTSYKHG